MLPRQIRSETLERRHLLAGDVCLASDYLASETAGGDVPALLSVDQVNDSGAEGEQATATSIFDWILPPGNDGSGSLAPQYDLLHELDGKVYSVRIASFGFESEATGPQSKLYAFERNGEGELVESATLTLDFIATDMQVVDGMLVIAGQDLGAFAMADAGPRTSAAVVAVDLQELTVQARFSVEGTFQSMQRQEDQLFVATSNPGVVPLIFPGPPQVMSITAFDFDGTSMTRKFSDQLAVGVAKWQVVGDEVLTVDRGVTDPTTSTGDLGSLLQWPDTQYVTRHRISGDQIDPMTRVEVPGNVTRGVQFSEDGQEAVVITEERTGFGSTGSATAIVSMVDLSDEGASVFESASIELERARYGFAFGSETVFLIDGADDLVLVNTNQQIDIDLRSRIRRLNLPEVQQGALPTISSLTEINPGTALLIRQSYQVDSETGVIGTGTMAEALVLSIDSMEIQSQTPLDSAALVVFTNPNQPPKLIGWSPTGLPGIERGLVVADLEGSGQLTLRQTIQLPIAADLDVSASRLLVREFDAVTEFQWDEPTASFSVAMGTPIEPAVAVDDAFRRNLAGRERYLDVLANDVAGRHFSFGPIMIVELIGAPAGVQIDDGGRFLRISDELLTEPSTIEFDYVIEQGGRRSSAAVSLQLFEYTDADVQLALRRIIATAATDLDVDPDAITIGNQSRFIRTRMPRNLAEGMSNPLAGRYGVVAELTVDGRLYRYAADFGDSVAQLSNRNLNKLMELRLRAVDAQGNPADDLQRGDTFFLEVTAQDLREAGRGVFSVAFDLALPANVLELTGEVQLLGDFDDVGMPDITAGIDDYQAIAFLVDPPGSDSQPVVRFGVRAVAGGDVTLRLDAADEPRKEMLLHGINSVISTLEVSYESLSLSIGGIRSTDTNASGAVTPLDALRVVNFLGRYGSQNTDGLSSLINGEGEAMDHQLASMRRLDTNADGRITPRDALAVINDIERLSGRGGSSAGGEGFPFDFFVDDEEEEDGDYELDPLSLI